MKRGNSLVVIMFLSSFFLVGCNLIKFEKESSSITSVTRTEALDPNAKVFNNYPGLTYTVTTYDSPVSDVVNGTITQAYYMPEQSTVCIDVLINDPQYNYVMYVARLGSSEDPNVDYSRDKIFEIDFSGDNTYICFDKLTKGENYIHIAKYGGNVLATFHYYDKNFNKSSK